MSAWINSSSDRYFPAPPLSGKNLARLMMRLEIWIFLEHLSRNIFTFLLKLLRCNKNKTTLMNILFGYEGLQLRPAVMLEHLKYSAGWC